MEAFAVSCPTLYLEGIILASTAYPSGFSHSLYTCWRGVPREGSTAYLGFLALPYLVVCPAVWAVRPGLLALRGTTAFWLIAAVLMTPVALSIEYVIHGAAFYRARSRFPTWFTVHQLWRRKLSLADHLLLGIAVVGEEFVYRAIWIGILHLSFGCPVLLALALSSLAYGANHLAFGGISILAKTVTGLLYGSLYLLGGQCIWLPILTHGLQNIALFSLARESHA